MPNGNLVHKVVDQLTSSQVVGIGMAGAGVTIASGRFDFEPLLQIASLGVGCLVGLASFVLVIIKIMRERKELKQFIQQSADDRNGMRTEGLEGRADIRADLARIEANLKALQDRERG